MSYSLYYVPLHVSRNRHSNLIMHEGQTIWWINIDNYVISMIIGIHEITQIFFNAISIKPMFVAASFHEYIERVHPCLLRLSTLPAQRQENGEMVATGRMISISWYLAEGKVRKWWNLSNITTAMGNGIELVCCWPWYREPRSCTVRVYREHKHPEAPRRSKCENSLEGIIRAETYQKWVIY